MGKQAVTVLCDSGAMRQAGLLAARPGWPCFGKSAAFEPPRGAAAGQRDPVRHLDSKAPWPREVGGAPGRPRGSSPRLPPPLCDIEEARFQAVRLQNHGGEGNSL